MEGRVHPGPQLAAATGLWAIPHDGEVVDAHLDIHGANGVISVTGKIHPEFALGRKITGQGPSQPVLHGSRERKLHRACPAALMRSRHSMASRRRAGPRGSRYRSGRNLRRAPSRGTPRRGDRSRAAPMFYLWCACELAYGAYPLGRTVEVAPPLRQPTVAYRPS